MIRGLYEQPALSEKFMTALLVRNSDIQDDVCDQLFNHVLDGHILAIVGMALKVIDYNDLCTKLRVANWRKIIKRIQLEFSKLTLVGDVRGSDNRNAEFENAVLFLQHGLVYREFSKAIRFGDPGRVEHCLKIFSIWI